MSTVILIEQNLLVVNYNINALLEYFEKFSGVNSKIYIELSDLFTSSNGISNMVKKQKKRFSKEEVEDFKSKLYKFDIKSMAKDPQIKAIVGFELLAKNEEERELYSDFAKLFFSLRQRIMFLQITQSKRIKRTVYSENYLEMIEKFEQFEKYVFENILQTI